MDDRTDPKWQMHQRMHARRSGRNRSRRERAPGVAKREITMTGSKELEERIRLHQNRPLSGEELATLVADVGESSLMGSLPVVSWLGSLLPRPEPLVRYNAMAALAFHGATFDWESPEGGRVLASLFEIAKNDTDSDCRRCAVAALGSFFSMTRRRAVAEFLGHVALDSSEAEDVRAFAYESLLEVGEIPRENRPNPFGLILDESHRATVKRLLGSLEPEMPITTSDAGAE